MKKLQPLNYLFALLAILLAACQQAPATKTAPAQVASEPSKEQPTVTTVSLENASTADLKIDGMMCAVGCAAKIEKNLADTPGVLEATIDFDNASGKIIFDPQLLSTEAIIGVVEQSGKNYKVKDIQLQ